MEITKKSDLFMHTTNPLFFFFSNIMISCTNSLFHFGQSGSLLSLVNLKKE